MSLIKLIDTTNFTILYENDPSILPNGTGQKRAAALAQVIESEFSILTKWFGITGGFGPGKRVTVSLETPGGGGFNFGYAKQEIHMGAQDSNPDDNAAADLVRVVFVSEFVELLMNYRNLQAGAVTWMANGSNGEALSNFCGSERYRKASYDYVGNYPVVNVWLQTPAMATPTHAAVGERPDYITTNLPTDQDQYTYGCGVLFLYYLFHQLNFSREDIIQKGGATLAETYKKLTGRSDAFQAFHDLLYSYFPVADTPILPTSDPFPLLDPPKREVFIDYSITPSDPGGQIIRLGTAEVSPYFLCKKKPYDFWVETAPKSLTCVATSRGFGQPQYVWQINGVSVSASGTIKPTTAVFSNDPRLPDGGTTVVQPIAIDCVVTNDVRTSTLAMTFPMRGGVPQLTIEVSASDKHVSPTLPSSAITWASVANEMLTFVSRYYEDREACRKAFEKYIRLNVQTPWINLLLTLPDPAPYEHVLTGVAQANLAFGLLQKKSPRVAEKLRAAFAETLGINEELLARIGTRNIRFGRQAPKQNERDAKRAKIATRRPTRSKGKKRSSRLPKIKR